MHHPNADVDSGCDPTTPHKRLTTVDGIPHAPNLRVRVAASRNSGPAASDLPFTINWTRNAARLGAGRSPIDTLIRQTPTTFGLHFTPHQNTSKIHAPKLQSPHSEICSQLFSPLSYSLLPKDLLTREASPRAPFYPVPPDLSATLKSRRGLAHSSRRLGAVLLSAPIWGAPLHHASSDYANFPLFNVRCFCRDARCIAAQRRSYASLDSAILLPPAAPAPCQLDFTATPIGQPLEPERFCPSCACRPGRKPCEGHRPPGFPTM